MNRLLRRAALAACLALALPAASGLARADDRQDLHRAFVHNLKLKSFKATMTDLGSNRVVMVTEFQAPDRFRITQPGQPPSVVIGDTMYMSAGGRAMQVPLPKGTISKFRNEESIRDLEKGSQVRLVGPGRVGTEPAMIYAFDNVTGKTQTRSKAWVGARSGHVLMMESTGMAGGKQQSMRMVYSDFNSPAIRITPPR